MKIKDSCVIKGIAVLFILFYHLFWETGRYEQFELTGFIGSSYTMECIATACYFSISLFVFVTAYGIAIKEKGDVYNKDYYIRNSIRRYTAFMKKFATVFLILLIISYVLHSEHSVAVWGEAKLSRMIGVLCNVTGMADIFGVPWFSVSWWYVSLAILLIFAVPVIHMVIKKIGACPSAFLALFLVGTFGFNITVDGLSRYLPIAVLGVIFAEYNILERIQEYVNTKKGLRCFLVVGLIMAIPFMAVIRLSINSTYMIDTVMALMVIGLAMLFIAKIPLLNTVLEFVGKNSLYMWLIHSFFTEYWFQDFTYKFKNIWIIELVLVVIISFISICISGIEKASVAFHGLISNTSSFIFSVFATIVCFAVAIASSPLSYLTNDDAGIQQLLSGNVTGEPYITHQFINVILGVFISSLYRAYPWVQWWYVYSLLLIAVGIFILHFCIIRISIDGKKGLKTAILAILVVDLSFMVYSIENVSFTIVPAVLGAGIVALLFYADRIKDKRKLKWIGCIVVFGYVLMLLHRSASAYAILCYILLGVLWNLTGRSAINKKLIINFGAVVIFFSVLTGCVSGLNRIADEKINGEEYIEFNTARAAYMDYPHDSYEENPELYEAVGWSKETYNLLSSWCFMDEAINTENFNYIVENSSKSNNMIASSKSLLKTVLTTTSCQAIIGVWIVSAFFAVFLVLIISNRRIFYFICMNNLGSIILLLYQLLRGRMLYRSIVVVLLPAVVINCILMIYNALIEKRENKIFEVLLIIALLCCGSLVLDYTFDTSRSLYQETTMNISKQIETYVLENPDNVYIYSPGVYFNINPWSVYVNEHLTNMIPWGGSTYNSDNYNQRLKRNGIDVLSGDVIKRDNVYVLFNDNLLAYETLPNEFVFYSWLQKNYNAIGFTVEDDIGQVTYVYRFVFEDNVSEFSTYYTIDNGRIIAVEK